MWWQLRKWPSASWVDLEANIQEWIKTKPSEIDLKEQYQIKCSCYTCVDFLRENFIYPSYINENRTCQCIWFLLPWQETQCSNFVPDQSCKEHTCTFQRVVAASQCCKYPEKLHILLNIDWNFKHMHIWHFANTFSWLFFSHKQTVIWLKQF